MSRDEHATRRGGSKTQISLTQTHPCGPGSLRIPVSLLPLNDIHDSHNSARGSPSSRQRVTLSCDNTITSHPKTCQLHRPRRMPNSWLAYVQVKT
ncbi:hypothetical protein ACE6H2_004272 [Prunus campanulata]